MKNSPSLPNNLVVPLQTEFVGTDTNERGAGGIINTPEGQIGWGFLALHLIKLHNGRKRLPLHLCPLPQIDIQFTSLSKAQPCLSVA